jgi:hypothetical protein
MAAMGVTSPTVISIIFLAIIISIVAGSLLVVNKYRHSKPIAKSSAELNEELNEESIEDNSKSKSAAKPDDGIFEAELL